MKKPRKPFHTMHPVIKHVHHTLFETGTTHPKKRGGGALSSTNIRHVKKSSKDINHKQTVTATKLTDNPRSRQSKSIIQQDLNIQPRHKKQEYDSTITHDKVRTVKLYTQTQSEATKFVLPARDGDNGTENSVV